MNQKRKIGIIIFGIVTIITIATFLLLSIMLQKENDRLEKESQKQESMIVKTKSGIAIETEYVQIGEKPIYIKIPTNFKQLDEQTIYKKYQGDVPDIVFSNDDTTINLAISITENSMADSQIEEYQKAMINLLKNNSTILDTKYYKVDKHSVGQMKLASKASDTNIYNHMICFSYQNKLIIMNFNCIERLQEEWFTVGDFLIDSLLFKE